MPRRQRFFPILSIQSMGIAMYSLTRRRSGNIAMVSRTGSGTPDPAASRWRHGGRRERVHILHTVGYHEIKRKTGRRIRAVNP